MLTTTHTIINQPSYETPFLQTSQRDLTRGIIFLIKDFESEQTHVCIFRMEKKANTREGVCPAFGVNVEENG